MKAIFAIFLLIFLLRAESDFQVVRDIERLVGSWTIAAFLVWFAYRGHEQLLLLIGRAVAPKPDAHD